VKTALGDFGAGSSSFRYLKRLPLDCLKTYGKFVRNVPTDPLHAAAVRCFVETEAIRNHFAELGVDLARGLPEHRPGPLPAARCPARAGGCCQPSTKL
jgi:EAL domain-containing protein (putative c-di-GMP-specific phosphodiesterase class I)